MGGVKTMPIDEQTFTTVDVITDNVRYNIEQEHEVVQASGKKLRDIQPDRYNRFMFICVLCSRLPKDKTWVSARVVQFYNYDISRILCFDCQNKEEKFEQWEARVIKARMRAKSFGMEPDTYAERAI